MIPLLSVVLEGTIGYHEYRKDAHLYVAVLLFSDRQPMIVGIIASSAQEAEGSITDHGLRPVHAEIMPMGEILHALQSVIDTGNIMPNTGVMM